MYYAEFDAIVGRMSSESQILAREGQNVLIVATQTNDLVQKLLADARNQVGSLGNVRQESPATLCEIMCKYSVCI